MITFFLLFPLSLFDQIALFPNRFKSIFAVFVFSEYHYACIADRLCFLKLHFRNFNIFLLEIIKYRHTLLYKITAAGLLAGDDIINPTNLYLLIHQSCPTYTILTPVMAFNCAFDNCVVPF